MKIYVCVKHVPDTAARISLKDETSYEDAVAIKFVMNPYDEYGVEEAVELAKANDGEVIVVTIGKAAASASIRAALAMGANRGIHVQTDQQYLDSAIVCQALKKAIEQDGNPDLIFTGKQSVDSEGVQTQYRLAAEMNMAVVSGVVGLSIEGDKAKAEREIGEGSREVLELSLPCVIGATKGLNTPRYPKLPDIMKAKKKEVKKIDLSELGIDMSGAKLELKKLEEAPSRSAAKMLSGSIPEMTKEFLRIMKEEEKVL
jgi:electron transfer flavoprotein beta subunit